MSAFLDRVAGVYFAQRVVNRGKGTVGRYLRPKLGTVRMPTVHGFVMDLDPEDLIQFSILTTGVWESAETDALRSELRFGDVVYDIGANVGYFSLMAAGLVGDGGHVYAFEPNPPTIGRLQRNLEINGVRNVTVVPAALSDHEGGAVFRQVLGANPGSSSLRPGLGGANEVEVELSRLDRLQSDLGLRPPNVVKMDIEGAELAALRGMSKMACPAWRALLVEVSGRFLGELGDDESALLSHLAGLGFEHTRDVSEHPAREPDGSRFQYTALFRRATQQRSG